jgi:dTDP-4-amino-4,6-dideoxygalactose transaminase
MTDLVAAIGRVQLKKVDTLSEKRRQRARWYEEGLAEVKGVVRPGGEKSHVYHQYTIRITEEAKRTRDEVVAYLKSKGIGCGIYYPKPLHLHPHFARLGFKPGDFPVAKQAAEQVLSLPVHPKLIKSDVAYVVKTIKDLL